MQIREIRKARGYTQQTLAEALNVTQGAVSQWEIGLTMPSIIDLCRLADLLNVTTDALLGRAAIGEQDDSATLKTMIEGSGYSYQRLEELTGIPKSAIQRYASGTTEKIPADRLRKLYKLLGRELIPTNPLTNQPTEKKGERTMITLNDLLTIVDARQLRLVVPVTERLKAQVTVNTRNAGELDDCVRLYGEWPIFSAEPAHEGAVMVIELTKDKGLALTEARG